MPSPCQGEASQLQEIQAAQATFRHPERAGPRDLRLHQAQEVRTDLPILIRCCLILFRFLLELNRIIRGKAHREVTATCPQAPEPKRCHPGFPSRLRRQLEEAHRHLIPREEV